VAQRRYLYNFFAGPLEINNQALAETTLPGGQTRYFVRVRGEDASDTGVQEIEQETEGGTVRRETVTANYVLLSVGKRLLVVKASPSAKGPVFEGGLGELPADVRSQVVAPLLKEYPNAEQAFLPLMLDATGFRNDGYIALAICIPAVLLAAWLGRKVMLRKNAPETHPIVRMASQYGPLADISQQLDAELRGGVEKFGKAKVTSTWVLLPKPFGLQMCRIPDLIWAYKKVTRHYHSFIPTGKTYEVIMYDRWGKPLQMQTKQKKVDAVLKLLAERAPWAVFGYSDELNKTLQTNWAGFVHAVDAKRSKAATAP
jgi:hypothetical protein